MPYLHHCGLCPLSFPVKHELLKHAKKEHFVCPTCKPWRTFATAESLKEHFRGSPHHPNCPECGAGFQNDKERDEHLRSHERSCANTDCRVYKVYERELQAHYQDSLRHPCCELCGEGVFDSTALAEHYRAHHEYCQNCAEPFPDTEALERHFKTHADHVCHVCGTGFPTKLERDTHTHSSSPETTHSGSSFTSGISSSWMLPTKPDDEAVAWVDILVCDPQQTVPAVSRNTDNIQSGISGSSTGWHSTPMCRLCGRDGCHGMSATMCGHIYCRRCICTIMRTTGRCSWCWRELTNIIVLDLS
ncbi:hypothetical protein BDZ89DRAFT_684981 [Hymenopellis radicata]|nr:hypothetical protein BDZ89DRAFT_684981 [Hymenopellis radicata]